MIRFENLQFSEFLIFVKFVFFCFITFHIFIEQSWSEVKTPLHMSKKIRFFIRQRFRLKKWKQQSIVSLFYLRCESEKKNLKCAKWNEIFSFFFSKIFFDEICFIIFKNQYSAYFFSSEFFFHEIFYFINSFQQQKRTISIFHNRRIIERNFKIFTVKFDVSNLFHTFIKYKILSTKHFNFDTSMIKFHFNKIFNQKRTIRSKLIIFVELCLCKIEIHTITNHYALRLEKNIAIKKSFDVINLCNTIFQKSFNR